MQHGLNTTNAYLFKTGQSRKPFHAWWTVIMGRKSSGSDTVDLIDNLSFVLCGGLFDNLSQSAPMR